jgi:DNA-binding MarR family transcriptional regulator
MPSESKLKTELDFLMALEGGHIITQMTLSKRIGVAVGLVNALLKRAMHKGYVKAKAAPYKRYAYYLTPTGFSEKTRLVAEYLESSLTFFRAVRQEYRDLLTRARMAGIHHVAFIGAGELADIALLAAQEVEIGVVALLDSRSIGERRLRGLPLVQLPTELPPVDGVVITDSSAPQAAFELIRSQFEESRILAPSFLRITRSPPEFKPRLEQK